MNGNDCSAQHRFVIDDNLLLSGNIQDKVANFSEIILKLLETINHNSADHHDLLPAAELQ